MWCWSRTICRQEHNANLPLLHSSFCDVLDILPLHEALVRNFGYIGRTYNCCNTAEVTFWSDCNRLHKKLITTFCIQGRVFFHRLEEYCKPLSAPVRRKWEIILIDLVLRLRCHSQFAQNWAGRNSYRHLALFTLIEKNLLLRRRSFDL